VFPSIQLPTINPNYATQAGSIPGKHRSFAKIRRSCTVNLIAVDANNKDRTLVESYQTREVKAVVLELNSRNE